MDKGEGIRALSRRFGIKWFSIACIRDDEILDISVMFGVNASTPKRARSPLGRRLTKLRNYEYGGLRLVAELILQYDSSWRGFAIAIVWNPPFLDAPNYDKMPEIQAGVAPRQQAGVAPGRFGENDNDQQPRRGRSYLW